MTTGDRGKDDLLEISLGLKNLGKSLIDLPQTLDELQEALKVYDKQLAAIDRTDEEERLYERFLVDHFSAKDLLSTKHPLSLKEYKT